MRKTQIEEETYFRYYFEEGENGGGFLFIINDKTNIFYMVSFIMDNGKPVLTMLRRSEHYNFLDFPKARQITALRCIELISSSVLNVVRTASEHQKRR